MLGGLGPRKNLIGGPSEGRAEPCWGPFSSLGPLKVLPLDPPPLSTALAPAPQSQTLAVWLRRESYYINLGSHQYQGIFLMHSNHEIASDIIPNNELRKSFTFDVIRKLLNQSIIRISR